LPPIFAITNDVRWMNFCGALTYPLYLVHRPLLDFAKGLKIGGTELGVQFVTLVTHLPMRPYLQFATASAFFLIACLMVAYAAHRLLERPLRAMFGAVLDRLPLHINGAYPPRRDAA
jgi:peptidoglycan/LPS O-acetylase OafA/YrhL